MKDKSNNKDRSRAFIEFCLLPENRKEFNINNETALALTKSLVNVCDCTRVSEFNPKIKFVCLYCKINFSNSDSFYHDGNFYSYNKIYSRIKFKYELFYSHYVQYLLSKNRTIKDVTYRDQASYIYDDVSKPEMNL